jgi:hypothetical protein
MSNLRYETDTSKIQCPSWIRNRYLQNTTSHLRYETDTYKIQRLSWGMKQLRPKYKSRTLLLDRICRQLTFCVLICRWCEKGDGTLVQKCKTKKTSDKCRLDTHYVPKFGPGTSEQCKVLLFVEAIASAAAWHSIQQLSRWCKCEGHYVTSSSVALRRNM